MFNSLSELQNYYPQCILCGKATNFYIGGYQKRPFWTDSYTYIKTITEGDYLLSINKDYPIRIQLSNNKVLQGNQIISNLLSSHIKLYQKCKTCLFQINYDFYSRDIENNFLPAASPLREELIYTMNNKKVVIYSYYKNEVSYLINNKINLLKNPIDLDPKTGYNSFIYLNDKLLSHHNFKITNFKNIKKLNKFVKTLLVFD